MRLAATLAILLALASSGCIVAGVYMLLGVAWAFIASGAVMMGASAMIARGLTNV